MVLKIIMVQKIKQSYSLSIRTLSFLYVSTPTTKKLLLVLVTETKNPNDLLVSAETSGSRTCISNVGDLLNIKMFSGS